MNARIENILQKIKSIRQAQGLTQENMASELGIGQASYNRLENGQSPLTLETMIDISELLGIKAEQLVSDPNTAIYNTNDDDNQSVSSIFNRISALFMEDYKKIIAENAILQLKVEKFKKELSQ